tara:strand:+ start:381 stop:623 length:243 start_codon:yes stop_codon:yes gene_type:complete
MFGPHMNEPSGVYFGGDAQTVDTPSHRIPLATTAPPAWLVADWLMSAKRGEPVSVIARHYLEARPQWNNGLHWISGYLNQ